MIALLPRLRAGEGLRLLPSAAVHLQLSSTKYLSLPSNAPAAARQGRDGALPGLPNHPAPNTPNILGHQGHHTGAELLRWHLLERGAGQGSSVWCLEWGLLPSPSQGKGAGGELLAESGVSVLATTVVGTGRTGGRLLHLLSCQMS